jgi:archaeosine synthase
MTIGLKVEESYNMQMRKELYQKVSCKKRNLIKSSLCLYNPYETYIALTKNSEVKKWLHFISNHYVPREAEVLLIYPCSAEKPYHKSKSFKQLSKTLSKLGKLREKVHVAIISEPFGLVPEEFFGKKTKWHDWENSWYDCPGLFQWWCDRNNQPYSLDFLDKSIELLAGYLAQFLKKANDKKSYRKIIAFVRTYSSNLEKKKDHTHRRIVERAAEIANVNVEILPPLSVVTNIVRERGRFAWDMYGVAHPMAQQYLLKYLRSILHED